MINHPLKLIAIGALGNMLGPTAKHIKNSKVAQIIRILDRGTESATHTERRLAWQQNKTQLIPDIKALVGDGEFDGIVICAGKNGDDQKIFLELVPLLAKQNIAHNYFILHLSTVSPEFVTATDAYCQKHNIQYANYPLTGGSKGAEMAKMLILASGSKELFQRVQPFLQQIGIPKYFDNEITSAAIVKLIGHVLVFHGLFGISLAALLHKNAFHLSPQDSVMQTEFFDFLNNGSGGTKQWEVALRHGIANNNWQEGFLLRHAVVDLIYAITLMLDKNIPATMLTPSLEVALLFTYILQQKQNQNMATQMLYHLLATTTKTEIDNFLKQHLSFDVEKSLQNCIELLPPNIRQSIALEIFY